MSGHISEQQALEKCIDFVNSIGIKIQFVEVVDDNFLPGLTIESGKLLIHRNSLLYPGDILHEAGHIAVVPAADRATLSTSSIGNRADRAAEEMMAIGWSYAACVFLDIDPRFVFHENGYKSGGNSMVDNFNAKRYIGVPMLQWIGLTADEVNAAGLNVPPYPFMIKWLRD